MDEPSGKAWDADADDGDEIVLLVQQGLLPLPLRSILTARLVCKQWRKSIGCLLDHVTLPFEAWSGSSDNSITSPQSALQRSRQMFASSPAEKAAHFTADPLEAEEGEDAPADADDIWVPPFALDVRSSKRRHSGSLAQPRPKQQRQLRQDAPGALDYESDTEPQELPLQHQEQEGEKDVVDHTDAEPPPQQQQQRSELAGEDELLADIVDYSVGEEHQHGQQVNSLQDQHGELVPSSTNNTDAAAAGTSAATAAASAAVAAAAAHPGASAAAAAGIPAAAGDAAFTGTSSAADAAGTPAAAVAAAAGTSLAAAPACASGCPRDAAAVSGGTHAAKHSTAQHPLRHLPAIFPCATQVTLLCRYRSSSASERATPSLSKLAMSLQILGQLPKLHTLVLQGSLPRPVWQPLLAGLQEKQQTQEQQQQQSGDHQQQQQQQQHEQEKLQLQTRVPCGLQERLVCLKMAGCDLPTAEVLEGLVGLRALRELVLHASIKSPALQPDHLEALSTGTQLESLSLVVYQIGLGGSSRVQLNPLLELTNLKSLDIAYKGIFNDQRPHFRSQGNITALQHLTSFSTSGLASPVIPQPALTALVSFSAVGNNRRLGGGSLATISSCSSIKALKIEAGKRGVAAVAAEHLHYIGAMQQLTSITLSLSKGSQAASKSTQQLLQLQIPGLKAFSVGSGDHRVGISTEQFQELAAQWPRLESLRLNSFSPLQGLAGLGAFTSLQALSLKPGTGTGKLLLELQAALEPLHQLKRLHLDFKSTLQLEHVEAIAIACADRLQHLSLNMRAVGYGSKAIDSKAVEYIAQLTCLTSLQLLGTRLGTFAASRAAVALQSMQGLRWLSVQAVEDTLTQSPAGLGRYLWNGLQTLTQLRELRVWLGSGVEGRHAQEALVQQVHAKLYDCTCYALQEPERPVM